MQRIKTPLIITNTTNKPSKKCALDLVTQLTVSEQWEYLLTFHDLTMFRETIPIPNQKATTIAKEFVTKIIFKSRIPDSILINQEIIFFE